LPELFWLWLAEPSLPLFDGEAGIAPGRAPLIGRLADRIGTRPLVLAGLAVMGLFTLFLATFTGGASVLPAGIGIFGLSVGFNLLLGLIDDLSDHVDTPPAAEADAPEIQKNLYSQKGRGIYASDLEQYFQRHGFRTFAFTLS